jgi:acyl-CoA thioesterase
MSDFFDLRATHNPHRWFLPITPEVAVGHGEHLFMFGGIGLAAGVTALERTCGRPVVWATAQYLSFARPGTVLDLDVWTPAEGRTVTQARVVGHVGDKEVITVNAALGARPQAPEGQWPRRPEAPPPQDCRPVGHDLGEHLGLHERLDIRVAHGRYRSDRPIEGASPDGRMVLWARARGDHPLDSGLVAVIADYLASGVPNAIGGPMVVNSLDNTIRFGAIEPSEWVLCDVRIELVHAGFAHGTMYMFADSGRLMAIASQTMVLRGPPPQS